MCMFFFFFYLCRVRMTSSCAQLCLRCRNLLSSKTVATTWQFAAQVHHCTPVSSGSKIPHGFSIFREHHRTEQLRQRWKQQIICYSDLTAKHLAAEAKENKITVTGSDVVANESHLLTTRDAVPLNESQMTLGTYWFTVADHGSIFAENQRL